MSDPILEIRGLRLAIKTDEGLAKVLDHIASPSNAVVSWVS